MVEFDIGRHGILLLVVLFLVMGIEDIVIFLNSGTLPTLEFFVGILVVLSVVALALREANRFPPPRR